MAEAEKQLEQIRDIRNMMERSSRFISLSGLSGVSAGFLALGGVGAFYAFMNRNLSYGYTAIAREVPVDISLSLKQFVILDALAIIVLALASAFFFTARKTKNMGGSIWDSAARRMMFNLFVPLVAGGIYCLVLLRYGWFGMIAPTMLIFYGLALLNASKYTLDEIRYLGLCEIALGIIGCFFIGYGITLWTIGFGFLHIIYGLFMYVKYDAKPKEKKYW